MKILIKYLLSFFSVAVFLAVTSGFTVYTHYCNDTATKKQSIVASQASCEHHNDVANSYNAYDVLSSCATGCHMSSESDECCTDEKQYYKISDDFIIPSVIVEDKGGFCPVITTTLGKLKLNFDRSFKESESTYSLPPPLSGKNIVLLYHQLKTDPDPAV